MRRSIPVTILGGMFILGAAGCAGDAPKHWGSFSQCMIGKPLSKGENVFLRLRGVQLAESMNGAPAENTWPARCEKHATALYESLDSSGKPGMIRRALSDQLGCDPACKFHAEGAPLPAADKLWEAVARAELTRGETPEKAPLAPLKVLLKSDWPTLVAGSHLAHETTPKGTWLLFGAKGARTLCAMTGAKANCQPLGQAPKFHASAPLNFVSGAARPIVVGGVLEEGGLQRVGYSPAEKKTVPVVGEQGVEVQTGFTFFQKPVEPTDSSPEREFEASRVNDGKVSAKAKFKMTARVRGPYVLHDWLALVERDDEKHAIFKARRLSDTGGVFAKEKVEFETAITGPYSVCQSEHGAAIASYTRPLRKFGEKADKRSEQLTSILLHDGQWSKPVSVKIPKQVDEFSSYSCGDGWGSLSWVTLTGGKLDVVELRCTPSSCETKNTSFSQPDILNVLLLERIGEKYLLLYQSKAKDVRVKFAPLADLAKAEPKPGFETEEFGGVAVKRPLFIPGAEGAYLLLQDAETRALFMSPDGELSPVAM